MTAGVSTPGTKATTVRITRTWERTFSRSPMPGAVPYHESINEPATSQTPGLCQLDYRQARVDPTEIDRRLTALGFIDDWVFEIHSTSGGEPAEAQYLDIARSCDLMILVIGQARSIATAAEYAEAWRDNPDKILPALHWQRPGRDGRFPSADRQSSLAHGRDNQAGAFTNAAKRLFTRFPKRP
jgi:hypothetical protein